MKARPITKSQVLARVPWSPDTFERKLKDGTFPAPFRLSEGGRKRFWLDSDVENFLSQRMQSRCE